MDARTHVHLYAGRTTRFERFLARVDVLPKLPNRVATLVHAIVSGEKFKSATFVPFDEWNLALKQARFFFTLRDKSVPVTVTQNEPVGIGNGITEISREKLPSRCTRQE